MRWQLASTFAAMAMSACSSERTVPCENGVLCSSDMACTGNSIESGLPLCGNPSDVAACSGSVMDAGARAPCTFNTGAPGVCTNNVCEPCKDFFECRLGEWSAMSVPTQGALRGVYVAAPNRAYSVGVGGNALTYDGVEWRPEIAGIPDTNMTLEKVWPIGGDVMVVGGVSVRTGQAPMSVPGGRANGLWGDGATLVAVGDAEAYGFNDGTAWSWTNPMDFFSYNAVWGWSGGTAIAVGTNGIVRRRTGNGWSDVTPAAGVGLVFNGVWGESDSDFYVVGHRDTANVPGIVMHYANGGWTDMTPSGTLQLNAIWGHRIDPSPTGVELFAVGARGTILRYDGSAWAPMPHANSTEADVNHIAGHVSNVGVDLMVVTNAGEIWRFAR